MASQNFANHTIWTGDCLGIMRGMNAESVDLIYLDPPFNSNANYAAPVSEAAGAAFKDTWSLSDVDAEWINLIASKHPVLYRVLLQVLPRLHGRAPVAAPRAQASRQHLSPLPTMSHYLHSDARHSETKLHGAIGGGGPKNDFSQHDVILRYARETPTFHVDDVRIPYSEDFRPADLHRPRLPFQRRLRFVQAERKRSRRLVADAADYAFLQRENRLSHAKTVTLAGSHRQGVQQSRRRSADPFCGCATSRAVGGHRPSSIAGELVLRRRRQPRSTMSSSPAHRSGQGSRQLTGQQDAAIRRAGRLCCTSDAAFR